MANWITNTRLSPRTCRASTQLQQSGSPDPLRYAAVISRHDYSCARRPSPAHARVETAAPFPLVDVDRTAGAPRDRADAGVAIKDAPAVLAFGVAAAGGEGGHSLHDYA